MKQATHFAGSFYQIDEILIDMSQVVYIAPKFPNNTLGVMLKGRIDITHFPSHHHDALKEALRDYLTNGQLRASAVSCH